MRAPIIPPNVMIEAKTEYYTKTRQKKNKLDNGKRNIQYFVYPIYSDLIEEEKVYPDEKCISFDLHYRHQISKCAHGGRKNL